MLIFYGLLLSLTANAQSTISSVGTTEISPTQTIFICPAISCAVNECEVDSSGCLTYKNEPITPCPSLPLCQFGEPINTGKVDASGCKIYSCPTAPCPSLPLCQFGGPINTGKVDASGCKIYSCPTAPCPSLPLCQFGGPINTGKVDASGCKIYSCPTRVCPAIVCSLSECPYGCETDASGCLTGKCKNELIISCLVYSLPDPTKWCKDGKIIPGAIDKNGCQGQPQCILPPTISKEPVLIEISASEGMRSISIEKISESRISIKEGAYSAISPSTFVVENSKIYMKISEGNKEIKILPKEASSKAAAATKINTIELKEESQQPTYSVIGTKQVKLFYLIPVSMNIETKVSAESGKVISVKKPWWSFFTR